MKYLEHGKYIFYLVSLIFVILIFVNIGGLFPTQFAQ